MKETLLDKAKAHKVPPRKTKLTLTDEHIEVALAWLKGDLSPSQVCYALGLDLVSGNYQRYMAILLREAYKKDLLKIA